VVKVVTNAIAVFETIAARGLDTVESLYLAVRDLKAMLKHDDPEAPEAKRQQGRPQISGHIVGHHELSGSGIHCRGSRASESCARPPPPRPSKRHIRPRPPPSIPP
jgi:hypothetical protein